MLLWGRPLGDKRKCDAKLQLNKKTIVDEDNAKALEWIDGIDKYINWVDGVC